MPMIREVYRIRNPIITERNLDQLISNIENSPNIRVGVCETNDTRTIIEIFYDINQSLDDQYLARILNQTFPNETARCVLMERTNHAEDLQDLYPEPSTPRTSIYIDPTQPPTTTTQSLIQTINTAPPTQQLQLINNLLQMLNRNSNPNTQTTLLTTLLLLQTEPNLHPNSTNHLNSELNTRLQNGSLEQTLTNILTPNTPTTEQDPLTQRELDILTPPLPQTPDNHTLPPANLLDTDVIN